MTWKLEDMEPDKLIRLVECDVVKINEAREVLGLESMESGNQSLFQLRQETNARHMGR